MSHAESRYRFENIVRSKELKLDHNSDSKSEEKSCRWRDGGGVHCKHAQKMKIEFRIRPNRVLARSL